MKEIEKEDYSVWEVREFRGGEWLVWRWELLD